MKSTVRLVCWLRIDILTSVLAESRDERQTGARLALYHMFDMALIELTDVATRYNKTIL